MKTLFTLISVALLMMAWLPFHKMAEGARHLSQWEPAIQALLELESATEVGLSYVDYSRRVTDAGVKVKTMIKQMEVRGADNCLVQATLERILDHHRSALDSWKSRLKWDDEVFNFFRESSWKDARKRLAMLRQFLAGNGESLRAWHADRLKQLQEAIERGNKKHIDPQGRLFWETDPLGKPRYIRSATILNCGVRPDWAQ